MYGRHLGHAHTQPVPSPSGYYLSARGQATFQAHFILAKHSETPKTPQARSVVPFIDFPQFVSKTPLAKGCQIAFKASHFAEAWAP